MKDILHTRQFENLIFELRGYKVMIDIASLYETETKKLKQQVKKNTDRFPPDFMFELTNEEKEQLVTNCDRLKNLKHSSINSLAFTEQGVAILFIVIRSAKAVKINIDIMRVFVYYRKILLQNQDLYKKVKELYNKINHVYQSLIDRLEIRKNIIEPVGYKLKPKQEHK